MRIVNLTYTVISVGTIAGIFIGLTQPLRAHIVPDTNGLVTFLIFVAIASVIGYLFARLYFKVIFKWWLLPGSVTYPGAFPDFERDRHLWRRNIIWATLTALITLGFFGDKIPIQPPEIPDNATLYEQVNLDGLTLKVPKHWLRIVPSDNNIDPYIYNVPISNILRRVAGPLNESVGVLINSFFQGKSLQGGIIFNFFLGPPVEGVFQNITASIKGEFLWKHRVFGQPLFSTLYIENADAEQQVVVTAWRFAPDSSSLFSRWQVYPP